MSDSALYRTLPAGYNEPKAALELTSQYNQRSQCDMQGVRLLHDLLKDGSGLTGLMPEEGTDSFMRIVDQEGDEVTFRILGVVLEAELPPILPQGRDTRAVRYLDQKIVLLGLECPEFSKAKSALLLVEQILKQRIESRHQSVTRGTTLDPLAISCRYLHRRINPWEKSIPIENAIDPTHRIARAMRENNRLIRTEDDKVEFCQIIYQPEFKVLPILASGILPGNIVEVEFCIRAYPMRDNNWILKNTLRGVALLDDSLTIEAYVANIEKNEYSDNRSKCKRRFGYTEEDQQQKRTREKKRKVQATGDTIVNRPAGMDVDEEAADRLQNMSIAGPSNSSSS